MKLQTIYSVICSLFYKHHYWYQYNNKKHKIYIGKNFRYENNVNCFDALIFVRLRPIWITAYSDKLIEHNNIKR